MARKQAESGEIENIAATLHREERAVAMQMAPFEAERERQLQLKADQEHREQMIAQSHEVAGQIKAAMMFSKFGDVSRLLWLKQAKETKIYRDLPNIGTWERYCNYLGLDRHTTDQDLLNLSTFGEEFLRTVTNLQVGYKDLRKLRQLTHDGSVTIDETTIIIDGKVIPFDGDHAEDLQAAIEWIIDEKKAISQRVERLEKDMNGIVKEETKGLKIEKDALLAEVKRLKIYDPLDKDRDWSIPMMEEVRKAAISLEVTINKFVIDPRMDGDRPLQAQVWAHLTAAIDQLEDLDKRMRDAFYSEE